MGPWKKLEGNLISALRDDGSLDRPRLQIPQIPKHIAIITGAGSAALSDMQRLIENRWPGLRRTIIGVTVQGDGSASNICQALAAAREMSKPEIGKEVTTPCC